MKPVLTFVLGAVLATAIALFVMRREPTPVAAPATPVATTPAPVEVPPAPVAVAPEPVAPPVARQSSPVRQREVRQNGRQDPRQDSRQAKRTQSPVETAASSGQEPTFKSDSTSSTTSTQASAQGGPPQTTLSMPPPPDSSLTPSKPAAPPRVPKTVTIPAGTLLTVRVDQKLSSDTVRTGDSFRASLDQPLVVDDAVIAERGARVEGRVAESDPGGRVRGSAAIALELVRLNTADGQRLRLQTDGFTKKAESSVKKDATKIGIGAGLGAAIGAIAGGGKGAAIGAGVGGAAGAGTVIGTRGSAAEIAPETRMTFRLSEAITVTEKLQ